MELAQAEGARGLRIEVGRRGQLAAERAHLESTDGVGGLVERAVVRTDVSADFRGGPGALVADFFDQEVDHLLRRHFPEVEPEADDDAGAAVHPPEQRADLLFRRGEVTVVPQQHLPVQCPAFYEERRTKARAIGGMASRHVELKVVAGNEFMRSHQLHEGPGVSPHRFELPLVRHRLVGIGDLDPRPAVGGIGQRALGLGTEHSHSPQVLGSFGDGDQLMFFEETDRLFRLGHRQGELPPRRHVVGLDLCQRLRGRRTTELRGGLRHLRLAPGELGLAGLDQVAGAVGDHLRLERLLQKSGSQRLADQRIIVLAFLAGLFFPQVRGEVLELLLQFLVGLAVPPGEGRIEAIVEFIPG